MERNGGKRPSLTGPGNTPTVQNGSPVASDGLGAGSGGLPDRQPGPGASHTLQKSVRREEQRGAERRLIVPAVVQTAWNRRLGSQRVVRGQVHLRNALMGPADVDLYKVQETGQRAALKEAGLGLLGLGSGVPQVALFLGEGAPAGGDGAEMTADGDLRVGAGIEGDKGGVGILAVAIALPDPIAAFTRFRNVQGSHIRVAGAAAGHRGRDCLATTRRGARQRKFLIMRESLAVKRRTPPRGPT
jgi:hypothetical protein